MLNHRVSQDRLISPLAPLSKIPLPSIDAVISKKRYDIKRRNSYDIESFYRSTKQKEKKKRKLRKETGNEKQGELTAFQLGLFNRPSTSHFLLGFNPLGNDGIMDVIPAIIGGGGGPPIPGIGGGIGPPIPPGGPFVPGIGGGGGGGGGPPIPGGIGGGGGPIEFGSGGGGGGGGVTFEPGIGGGNIGQFVFYV